MKAALFPLLLGLLSAAAQDITFTNKTVTFTNLEGRVYKDATLVRADLDGIIWRGDGVGRVSYTNLSPALLEAWGVPTNRIEIARARAEHKAHSDAAYNAAAAADAAARLRAMEQERKEEAKREAIEAPIRDRKERLAALDQQIAQLEAQLAQDMQRRDAAWRYYVRTPDDASSVTLSSRGGNTVDNADTRLQNAYNMDSLISAERDKLSSLRQERALVNAGRN